MSFFERPKYTDRQKERRKEDKDYQNAIVKRIDQTKRHPDDTLNISIADGMDQYSRNLASLILSSVTAGFIMSLTIICIGFALNISGAQDLSFNRFYMAFFYPLPFILTVLSGTQLFTEQTAVAVYPFIDKKVKFLELIKFWLTVLFGNLLGSFIGVFAIVFVKSDDPGFLQTIPVMTQHLFEASAGKNIVSSIFAGFLMAHGGWLITSMFSSMGQIIAIYIVTFIIAIGGFFHSIAGSAEVFALLSYDFSWPHLLSASSFLALCVFGNLLGGAIFVGFLNFAYIRAANT